MTIYFLHERPDLLQQYVELRNLHAKALITDQTTEEKTQEWLKTTNSLVRIAVEDKKLCGVVMLNPEKENEVSIFVRDPGKGCGLTLLIDIEEQARLHGIHDLNAWTLLTNMAAQGLFQKNKYTRVGEKEKQVGNLVYHGVAYHKELV
jgi:N-acetylglutamate synthase-like GNAT family acetyltransferase